MRISEHHCLITILCVIATGCWNSDEPPLPQGNTALGITSFIHEEDGDRTTLRGLDARGNEVARLELVHGRFTVTPPFTDDYETPNVDGRKLNVHALGQQLHWETAGFDPVLEMPAQPPTQWALAAFLADPHAKPILDRWGIGFLPSHAADDEVAYYAGGFRGDSPQTCDNSATCGIAHFGTVNTCGGGGIATKAARLTRQPGTNCGLYTGPTNSEVRVAQCCPAGAGGQAVPWFAEKACPTTSNTSTSCGTLGVGAVCKGCPEYPIAATETCSVTVGATVGTCGVSVYPIDWSFIGYTYIKASNTGSEDYFARAVAISRDGNTVAVGANGEDSNATGIGGNQADDSKLDSGALYVFARSGAVWSQQAYIKASNTDAGDAFGLTAALSTDGNTLAVGAPAEASVSTGINGNQADNSEQYAGAVYIFTRSGTAWTQQAYIKASTVIWRHAWFGSSLALSSDGNTLAVGSPEEDSDATGVNGDQANMNMYKSGAVYVYTRSGTTWSQQAYVKASNTGPDDFFGTSVALSGDSNTLAVSAPFEDSNATGINGTQSNNSALDSGAVYVFTRSGTSWSQQAYIKASNTGAGDLFGGIENSGLSLSSNGNTLAVGATQEDSNATGIGGSQSNNSATDSGAAYVFTRSGTSWSQQAYFKPSTNYVGGSGGGRFGKGTALSDDGNMFVASAPQEDCASTGINGNQSDFTQWSAGAAYRFIRVGSTWSQDRYIKASNTGGGDHFGYTLSMSSTGSRLLSGAKVEDSNATGVNGDQANNLSFNSGAIYIID